MEGSEAKQIHTIKTLYGAYLHLKYVYLCRTVSLFALVDGMVELINYLLADE